LNDTTFPNMTRVFSPKWTEKGLAYISYMQMVSIKQLLGRYTIEGRQTDRTIRLFSQLLKLNRVK